MFHNNYELCFENTIDWKDILTGNDADVSYKRDANDQTSRSCKYWMLTVADGND